MSENIPKFYLTPDEAALFIAEEQQRAERRGDFVARPVQIQKLNQFGSPQLAVLTRVSEAGLTVAGLLPVEIDDGLVIYDDQAPGGAAIFYGVVESIRPPHRTTDTIKGMRLIYMTKTLVEQAAEQAVGANS